MVQASTLPDATGSLLGPISHPLALRVCGTEHDGCIVRLRASKCTVGSDPTCTLRLRSDEISPVHCLILRGTAGTFVRRWSADTTLNGFGFDFAPLRVGDRLRIGTVEFEVLPESVQEEVDTAIPPAAPASPPPTPAPDWQAEQARFTEQCAALSAENAQLHQALTARDEQARLALIEHREQLESLQKELASVLASGTAQRAAQAELAAKAEAAVEQLFALHTEVTQVRTRLEQQETESATARGHLEAELAECRQQLAVAQSQAAEKDRAAADEMSRELAACREQLADRQAELDRARTELAEQGELWRRERERLESEFGEALAAAQAREQCLDEELRSIRTEIEAWQRSQLQPAPVVDSAARRVVTEPMPIESPGCTLALDPRELALAALAAVEQQGDGANEGGPAVADACPASSDSVENADAQASAAEGEDAADIDRYMERLLRRVGTAPEHSEPQSVPECLPVAELGPAVDPVVAEPEVASPPVEPPKRSEPAVVEAHEDLEAMRELAERPARRPITHSGRRWQVRVMISELGVAGVCLVSGIIAAMLSRSTLSVETIGGALGISFGLVFTARAVHRIRRLRQQAVAPSLPEER